MQPARQPTPPEPAWRALPTCWSHGALRPASATAQPPLPLPRPTARRHFVCARPPCTGCPCRKAWRGRMQHARTLCPLRPVPWLRPRPKTPGSSA